MESKTTEEFWDLFYALPAGTQKLARSKYLLWLENNGHKSLEFRKVSGKHEMWRVSIGYHYRAICLKTDDLYTWFWIGTHEEYNGIV